MAGTSRVNREIYARFCGGLVVKFLRPTRRNRVNERTKEASPVHPLSRLPCPEGRDRMAEQVSRDPLDGTCANGPRH